MHSIIIANGKPPSKALLTKELTQNSTIICADGGANALFASQILPHYIIGDLDSITKPTLDFFKLQGVNIEEYPRNKNSSDLELAFAKAVELGTTRLTLLGATGGRLDHFLVNIGILSKAAQLKIKASIQDKNHVIKLLNKTATISGTQGTIFSLHAYSGTVKNLSISGSKYELKNYNLLPGDGRTLSNEFLDQEVTIEFSNGKLLLIQRNS